MYPLYYFKKMYIHTVKYNFVYVLYSDISLIG